MVWDGEVLNYTPWRDLIDKELQNFQTEEEKIFFVASHISCTKMISFIKNCSSTEDMFMCLDAEAATVYEVITDMKDELNDLPTFPEDYCIENSNIKQLVMYIRTRRKNQFSPGGSYMPHDPSEFVFLYANKLSRRNAEELMRISKESDDIEYILKFLYNIQRTNNIMQWSTDRVARKRIPIVVSKEKVMTPAKQVIKSKLSRIRKKFYLHHDEHTANEYKREVRKYLKVFKPNRKERKKWETKIQKTCNDVIQPMLCPEPAGACRNDSESEEVQNDSESEEVKNDSEIAPQATLCLPEVPESDSEVEEELFLPSVPQENPGDQDDDLHRRLKRLKKKERRSTPIQLVPARTVHIPQSTRPVATAPVTKNTLLPGQKNDEKDLTTYVTQKTPGNDEETTYLDEAIKNDMNKNIPQQVLFLLLLMMMVLTESVKKLNGRINQPPAKCHCNCYRKTAEVLPAERLAEFPLWPDLKVRAVLWIQSRLKVACRWVTDMLMEME